MRTARSVCTGGALHEGPTKALELGYDVLLEKPLAPTLEACMSIVRTAERTGRQLMLAHTMRYTDYFTRIREIVQGGDLGGIVTVEHRENVSSDHAAHSLGRDHRFFAAYLRVLRGEEAPRTSARESVERHLMAFAAEKSRLTGRQSTWLSSAVPTDVLTETPA